MSTPPLLMIPKWVDCDVNLAWFVCRTGEAIEIMANAGCCSYTSFQIALSSPESGNRVSSLVCISPVWCSLFPPSVRDDAITIFHYRFFCYLYTLLINHLWSCTLFWLNVFVLF